MSDYNSFRLMLDRAGFSYTMSEERLFDFKRAYKEASSVKYGPMCHLLEVDGLFYDSLYVWFDKESGRLMNMISHVAYWGPGCEQAKRVHQELGL